MNKLLKSLYLNWQIFPVWLFFIFVGLHGVNFGYHWDEWYHVANANYDISQPSLLITPFYSYPSVTHWLTLLSLFPSYIFSLFSNQALIVEEPLMATRGVFVIISSLTIIWIYWLTKHLTQSKLAAIVASSLWAFSWEASYHSRWVASDLIMVQFCTLALIPLYLFFRHKQTKYLYWFAFVLGIATGTKYQAGIVLVFPLLYALTHKKQWRNILPQLTLLLVIAVTTFLLTTPGIVLTTSRFMSGFENAIVAYKYGHRHLNYLVGNRTESVFLSLNYLTTVFFSKYLLINGLIFGSVVYSAYAGIKQKRNWFQLGLIVVPTLYLLVISNTKVLIVRNLLLVTPFISILFGIGVSKLKKTSLSVISLLIILVVGLSLLSNGYRQYTASTMSPHFNPQFSSLLNQISSKQTAIFISKNAKRKLTQSEHIPRLNSVALETAELALITQSDEATIPANYGRQFLGWSGASPTNLNYYPNWDCQDCLIVVDLNKWRLNTARLGHIEKTVIPEPKLNLPSQ